MHNWGTFFKEVTLLFFPPPITPYYIYRRTKERGCTKKLFCPELKKTVKHI